MTINTEDLIFLQIAKLDPIYQQHVIGDKYYMLNVGGVKDKNIWKIAYYPLSGTYKGDGDDKKWVKFEEPRALIETPHENGGTDFREVPLRYLQKITES